MYFVCIKFAKFIHNLIPVYNNLVVQGSGLFYFGIFVCVCWSLSFFLLLSFLFPFCSFCFYSACDQAILNYNWRGPEPLCSTLKSYQSTLLWETMRMMLVVFFLTSRGLFCSNFILFCFVLSSLILERSFPVPT